MRDRFWLVLGVLLVAVIVSFASIGSRGVAKHGAVDHPAHGSPDKDSESSGDAEVRAYRYLVTRRGALLGRRRVGARP